MAANPYIVTTDNLTTEQELAIARNTRAKILAVGQEYYVGNRRMRYPELREVEANIARLEAKLEEETNAASGGNPTQNLVRFVRHS